MVGRKQGQTFLPGDFSGVLMQYDDLAGAATNNIEARINELHTDGVDKELAFPNAVLALFHYPDKELRERVFRIYNEHMAELQEKSNGHFYAVGLINWWDPKGTRRTLRELKSLGLKTFLMPINPGKDDDDNVIDYGATSMNAVWDEIEDAGLPVTHHIGETPPKTPCEFNSVVVGMMINVDGFREVFSKYIFSGILDRHPKLRIGWFEGGIAWVPCGSSGRRTPAGVLPAHVQPSTRARHPVLLGQPYERVVHGRPAGPSADRPDRRRPGVLVVGLSTQREHVRLFGEVARVGGRSGRPGQCNQDRQRKHQEVPGRVMTTFVKDELSALGIPDEPDRGRMLREIGARLRAAMADKGVDALILLGNGNVVYATGASWPLLDAGLSHVERPVAIVLADDDFPHLYIPFREGAAFEIDIPADHIHGPLYLEFDEGVEQFARILADLLPPAAKVAVDEMTGSMRRSATRIFPSGPPSDAAQVIGPAKLVKTRDQIACIRRACRITEQAMADVQNSLKPGVRQIDLSAEFVRQAFEHGATANMLEAIWQVMPNTKAEGTWTTTGDLALPLLTTERELAAGDVLWTDASITYSGYCSDFGRTWLVGDTPTARQHAQFDKWREILDAVLESDEGRGDVRRSGTRRDRGQRRREAVAAALLPGPWHRHQRRRDADDRNRSRPGVRR